MGRKKINPQIGMDPANRQFIVDHGSIRSISEVEKIDRSEFILGILKARAKLYSEGSSIINETKNVEIEKLKKKFLSRSYGTGKSETEKRLEHINTVHRNVRETYESLRQDFNENLDPDIKFIAERMMSDLQLEAVVVTCEVEGERLLRGGEYKDENNEMISSFVFEKGRVQSWAESENKALCKRSDDWAKEAARERKELLISYGSMAGKYCAKPTRISRGYSLIKGLGFMLYSIFAN